MTVVEYVVAAQLCPDPVPVPGKTVCAVYRTTHEDRPALLKIPRVERPLFSSQHVRRDARVLEELAAVPALPRVFGSWDLHEKQSTAAIAKDLYGEEHRAFGLLREYLEGVSLRSALRCGLSVDAQGFHDDIKQIHRHGYACLDLHEGNILVDPAGCVRLIDCGLAVHQSEVPKHEFSGLKSLDCTDAVKLLSLR